MGFTVRHLRFAVTIFAIGLFLASPAQTEAAASDWIAAPRPKFPQSALKNGFEGSVTLRLEIRKDGNVTAAKILKSSGRPDLDVAAQRAVLKWRLDPRAIKPKDLTIGRDEIIDFRQEAPIAAIYPDRAAAFISKKGVIGDTRLADIWMVAPFPSYPLEAREQYLEGTCNISLSIGKDGKPQGIRLAKSCGHAILDRAALRAVALWRAHARFAGRTLTIPIHFYIARHRHG
jgi:TonB family protein